MRQPDPSNLDEILAAVGDLDPSIRPDLQPPTASGLRTTGLRLIRRGYQREAETCLKSAWQRAGESSDAGLFSQLSMDLAQCRIDRSPGEAARFLLNRDTLDAVGDGSCSRFDNLLGIVCKELGRFGAADRRFRRAATVAREDGDTFLHACVEANRAGVMTEQGRLDEALAINERALGMLGDLDRLEHIVLVLLNDAVTRMVRMAYEPAARSLERAGEVQRKSGNPKLAAYHELIAGELELATGDRYQALAHFVHAAGCGRKAAVPAIQAKALVWRAILQADKAKRELERDIANVARDLCSRDLKADGRMIYLIAAAFAESRGGSGERYLSTARALSGDGEESTPFVHHYMRLVAAAGSRRRGRAGRDPFPGYLTRSPVIRGTKDELDRLVDTDVRILIEGESGTGKSFLAQGIHQAGKRRRSPFVTVDCTNLDESLFESKLFGHRRGSFTGAVSDSMGLVEQADGGTLFLDEIGEIPTRIQARLLYTIESGRFRPVGSRVEKQASFRVIAATNRDLDRMLADGSLRSDLFFRLSGYRVNLPPLRERREDIVPLIELALERLNERHGRRKVLRPGVWERLVRYDWPGNVRELNATLERGYHLAVGRRIGIADLGPSVASEATVLADLSWDAVRREHLLRVLRMCRGNVSRAARLLGLHRTTLIYKLQGLEIEREDFDPAYAEGAGRDDDARRVADRADDEPAPGS